MRVLLVPNTHNPAALSACGELATWLSARGFEPALATEDALASDLSSHAVSPNDLGDLSLVVALGGDGTLLKAVHLTGEREVPVLGVKYGRLGFLSGATAETMRDAVEAALAGDARVERRSTLHAEAIMDGRVVGTYRSLNEVVVTRGPSGRVIGLDVSVDGHQVWRAHADGVVVATATGSTAYALSAGGPIVSPGFSGMVVVPVAPHRLAARAVLTGPSDVVEIELSDPSRNDACLIVDGDATPCRRSLERVIVRRGDHDVSLVKLDGRDFYETVAEEFFGG